MAKSLFYNTVNPILLSTLKKLMESPLFASFRLVGGTSLSLQLGHRQSVDIDLFADSEYSSINFAAIDEYLKRNFNYVDSLNTAIIGMGKSWFIGESVNHCIKLDLYYTDSFIRPVLIRDEIRFASLEDITAMKIDVIARGGRKKDFWDIHELLEIFTLEQMLDLHKERNPWSHDTEEILKKLIEFEQADGDFDPRCMKNKHWELIKLDILETVKGEV